MIQAARVPVVVVQGQCLLRSTLIERLEREDWIEVCGLADKVEEVGHLVKEHNPAILVVNISLRCSSGVSSIRQLKRNYTGLSVVVFSCDPEFEGTSVGHVLKAGADDYVSSRDSLDSLVGAVRAVSEKRHYMTCKKTEERLDRHSIMLGLSSREAEVFCLTGCGHVPQHVADMLGVKVKTVETLRDRIRAKLGLGNGADLQFAATSVMRAAARGGYRRQEHAIVKKLFSTKG